MKISQSGDSSSIKQDRPLATGPIRTFAPAKINLALHVIGQRADGYHLLDSLVVFADFGDTLELRPGPRLEVVVDGPFAEGVPIDERNLVWRAAILAGWTGEIKLQKHLPHGAGIGGGSSDAAAVLRALNYHGSGVMLGADVPVCQRAQATRMAGIGDQLTPVEPRPRLHAVLVNPGCVLPTREVFRGLESKTNAPLDAVPTSPDWISWLRTQRNDLQSPAIAIAPEISGVLSVLEEDSACQLARMSGSGATCFGLYQSEEDARRAADTLKAVQPGWWCVATTLN